MDHTCPECGRTFARAIEALAKNRMCMYCGGALALSSEIEAALQGVKSKPGAAAHPVMVTCLLCGTLSRYKEAPGGAVRCKMCGYPQGVSSDGGPGVILLVSNQEAAPASYSCTDCGGEFSLDGAATARVVSCPQCARQYDFTAWTPNDLFGELSIDEPRLRLAHELLEAGWRSSVVTLASARELHDWIRRLALWLGGPARETVLSPLPPAATADLALYCVGEGTVWKGKDGDGRLCCTGFLEGGKAREIRMASDEYKKKHAAKQIAQGVGKEFGAVGALFGAAVSAGLDVPEPEDPLKTMITFQFSAQGDSTAVAISSTCPDETYLSLSKDLERLQALTYLNRIRKNLANAAPAAILFRIFFGDAALPSMMPALKPETLERRLMNALPQYADRLAAVTAAILSPNQPVTTLSS